MCAGLIAGGLEAILLCAGLIAGGLEALLLCAGLIAGGLEALLLCAGLIAGGLEALLLCAGSIAGGPGVPAAAYGFWSGVIPWAESFVKVSVVFVPGFAAFIAGVVGLPAGLGEEVAGGHYCGCADG